MEYVSVPVPEDLVADVNRLVLWLNLGIGHQYPGAELLAKTFGEFDDLVWVVLSKLAHAALEGKRLTVSQVATMTGRGEREISGAVTEINNRVRLAGGPTMIITFVTTPPDADDPSSAQTFRWDRGLLVLSEDVARSIRDVEGGARF